MLVVSSDGEVTLIPYRNLVWKRCTLRSTSKQCQRCRKKLRKGESAYRPLSNGMHRMDRVCGRCMNRVFLDLLKQAERETPQPPKKSGA